MKIKTNKENGWTYIRIKLDTVKVLKIMKAELVLPTYDDMIKLLVSKYKK
jgi:hypothetical protein